MMMSLADQAGPRFVLVITWPWRTGQDAERSRPCLSAHFGRRHQWPSIEIDYRDIGRNADCCPGSIVPEIPRFTDQGLGESGSQ
jgi:hypothetical protein